MVQIAPAAGSNIRVIGSIVQILREAASGRVSNIVLSWTTALACVNSHLIEGAAVDEREAFQDCSGIVPGSMWHE